MLSRSTVIEHLLCVLIIRRTQRTTRTVTIFPITTSFRSDALEDDNNSQIVTARGNVELVREGNRLRADEVVWNRATGEVRANGNISVTNPQGDIAYGDSIELTDTLKDGIVENLLLEIGRAHV